MFNKKRDKNLYPMILSIILTRLFFSRISINRKTKIKKRPRVQFLQKEEKLR
jgi:hypothetical protein